MTRAVLTAACLLLLGTSTALAGDTLWTRRDSGDNARAVLVDQEDNIIAVGTRIDVGTGNDVVVVKYSPDGTRQWYVTIAGPGASKDEAKGAALDPFGNIYITASTGVFPNYNIMTVKLTATGTESWRRTWDGADNKPDAPAGIAVDSAGNAYVTGYTSTANGLTDWVTMKLAPDSGLPLWTVIRPGEGGGNAYATAIALGPDGSPYITGHVTGQYMEDYCTVKYSTVGVEQWASFYDYSGNGPDEAVDIVVDDAGDAYVTGWSASASAPGGLNQYATVKYGNDSGTEIWATRYTGDDGNNSPAAIALGASAVYVTGSSQKDTGDHDYATVAYDKSSGSQLWATRFDGVPGKADDAADITVLPYGMVLVTGTSIDQGDTADIVTFRYTDAGAVDWAARFNDAVAAAIAFDSHCNPIVLGSSLVGGYYEFLTVKYDSAASGGIAEFTPAVPGRPGMRLAPNPARNWTSVTHSPSGATPAIVSVLGVDGRVVSTQRLDGQAGAPARLDLTGLASGVYTVCLDAAGQHATSRLVVLQ